MFKLIVVLCLVAPLQAESLREMRASRIAEYRGGQLIKQYIAYNWYSKNHGLPAKWERKSLVRRAVSKFHLWSKKTGEQAAWLEVEADQVDHCFTVFFKIK